MTAMDASFGKLLSRVYELEGLLLIVEKHDNETPQLVIDMIKEKAGQIQELASGVTLPAQVDAAIQALHDDAQEAAAGEPADKVAPVDEEKETELPSKDYDADETWQHDNGEEFNEVFSTDYVEPTRIAVEQPPVFKPEPPVEDTVVPELDIPHENDEEIEFSDDVENEDDEKFLRVDEKLQRDLSKDMRKAFSLNDRFRFRRELFGNSDLEMNDALDMIDSMKTFDEATEYFYGDLGWDQENEEVTDFMEVVKKHFL